MLSGMSSVYAHCFTFKNEFLMSTRIWSEVIGKRKDEWMIMLQNKMKICFGSVKMGGLFI